MLRLASNGITADTGTRRVQGARPSLSHSGISVFLSSRSARGGQYRALNHAMSDIETNNPELADTLPKNYQEVPNQVLVELIKLLDYKGANGEIKVSTLLIEIKTTEGNNTDLRKFLDMSVSSISGHIAGATYRAGEPGAQATAQSERIRPWSVANRFQAVSQASMMSARLRNTELASQWLRLLEGGRIESRRPERSGAAFARTPSAAGARTQEPTRVRQSADRQWHLVAHPHWGALARSAGEAR